MADLLLVWHFLNSEEVRLRLTDDSDVVERCPLVIGKVLEKTNGLEKSMWNSFGNFGKVNPPITCVYLSFLSSVHRLLSTHFFLFCQTLCHIYINLFFDEPIEKFYIFRGNGVGFPLHLSAKKLFLSGIEKRHIYYISNYVWGFMECCDLNEYKLSYNILLRPRAFGECDHLRSLGTRQNTAG